MLFLSACSNPFLPETREVNIDEKEDVEEVVVEVEIEEERTTREEEIEQFIRVNSPVNGESFHAWNDDTPIVFNGEVSKDTTKIVVTAWYEEMTWSEMQESIIMIDQTDVYTLQNYVAGETSFTYRAAPEWDNLGFGINEYKFVAYHEDGNSSDFNMSITYEADGLGKPVIYLYPETPTVVDVIVETELGLTVSIPEMGEAWKVLASPDGKILNLADMLFYPYLFWEALAPPHEEIEEGFVVARGELGGFFDEKLSVLGLNAREIADFKDYWLKQMKDAPYYLIQFVDQSYLDEHAALHISPEPDSVIRVYFDYQALDEWMPMEEQKLEPRERHGFAVTEWGGPMIIPQK